MNITTHLTLSRTLVLVATSMALVFSLACTPVSFSFSLQRADAKTTKTTTKTSKKKNKKSTSHAKAKTAHGKTTKLVATKNKKTISTDNNVAPATDVSSSTGIYTMAQVATANTETKCWTVIDGTVYDLTLWISKHPGGQENIVSICGIDGTQAFNSQHAGQGRPERILATYRIGTLQNTAQQ